jgi:hypothetical protein
LGIRIRKFGFVVPLPDTQSGTHVSTASTLQVRLKQQALHLAAFGLLLALDLVQRELQSGRCRQPSLQRRELLPGVKPGVTRVGDQRFSGGLWNDAGGMGKAGPKPVRSQTCGRSHVTTVIYTVGKP